MSFLGAGIPYLVIALLGVTFLWGSIMAFRGRKWWATWLLLLGSAAQVLAALALAVAMVVMVRSFAPPMASGGHAPTAVTTVLPFLLGVGMIIYALGFILFGAGFVGLCGRSGATERRAAELEGMLADLQERMNQPS